MNTTPPPAEPLARALQRAAATLDAQAPPAGLRAAVLQQLARPTTAPAAVAKPRWRWTAWSGGAAVAAMLAVGSLVLWIEPPPAPTRQALSREFLPLVPREDWPAEASPAWLVASELPQERLAALGLPYDPSRAAESVRAELLVHPSGLVLALRLID